MLVLHLLAVAQQNLLLCSTLPFITWLFMQSWPRKEEGKAVPTELEIAKEVRKAKNVHQICGLHGYSVEDHTVQTEDGYLLTLQRLLPKADGRTAPSRRPVVYMQHGLLTSSELYMRVADAKRCIPLVLVEKGFDVWLGNNRGNKYSQNHISKDVNSDEFWDFSLDEFAAHDIPSSINYVLQATKAPKLSYIGFSQGTAQAFAALSLQPELNDKLDVFIALAPILSPPGYASSFLDSGFKNNPDTYFWVFGRRSMFPSVRTLQSIIPITLLRNIVDVALSYLLGAQCHNLSIPQKLASYPHIYCSSSVKSVVHWAQIMRNSSFGPFQKNEGGTTEGDLKKFPTEKIKTPMVLLWGDRDGLFNIEKALEQLPVHVRHSRLDGYEHIDVLWGQNVHIDVIPKILDALDRRETV